MPHKLRHKSIMFKVLSGSGNLAIIHTNLIYLQRYLLTRFITWTFLSLYLWEQNENFVFWTPDATYLSNFKGNFLCRIVIEGFCFIVHAWNFRYMLKEFESNIALEFFDYVNISLLYLHIFMKIWNSWVSIKISGEKIFGT